MRQTLAAVVAATMVFAPPALVAGSLAKSVTTETTTAGFSKLERQLINTYFANESDQANNEDSRSLEKANGRKRHKGKNTDLSPGLANGYEPPPGLASQLEKNGRLPPGLAMRGLPAALESKLPAPPQGYVRIIVGNDVVLVDVATAIIRDIARNVISH